MRTFGVLVSTCGYVGYVPVAPGTAGSLLGLGLYAFVRWCDVWGLEIFVILAITILGIWSASVGERYFERKDPGYIIIDEVAGILFTFLFLPVTWIGAIIGFLVFRFFDIVKPFPVRQTERLPGGWGVMFDDLVAAVYSHLVIRLLALAMPALLVV
jgi:phosphatidylglycerophosphatase A